MPYDPVETARLISRSLSDCEAEVALLVREAGDHDFSEFCDRLYRQGLGGFEETLAVKLWCAWYHVTIGAALQALKSRNPSE
jgi:hypothetical protein